LQISAFFREYSVFLTKNIICLQVMKIFEKVKDLNKFLDPLRKKGKVIGFVPTMGALHSGHISLIEKCRSECDITVVSIFVNPLQFNDKNDFRNYPKTIDADNDKLIQAGCDVVFIPEEKEMYPSAEKKHYPLGKIEEVMEGKHRPGHFQGVARVIERLFEIVKPDKAFFGAKDYQQVMIVKRTVEITLQPVEIITCPTVRERDGLAMSSRNMRLTPEQRKSAPAVFFALSQVPEMLRKNSYGSVSEWFENYINNVPYLKSEYFKIADSKSLDIVTETVAGRTYIAFTAVQCGNIRLIDNIFFVM
jgi:pantoate--beta-alanine ligase